MMGIVCGNCGRILFPEDEKCPICGSYDRTITEAEGIILDDLGGENEDKVRGIRIIGDDKGRYKSKNHPHYKTAFLRREWNYKRGEYVIRFKSEDRLLDEYREVVTSKDGEEILNVTEKLSKHQGHGISKRDGGKK